MDNFYLILKMRNFKNIKITDFQCLDIGNINVGTFRQIIIENDIRKPKSKLMKHIYFYSVKNF